MTDAAIQTNGAPGGRAALILAGQPILGLSSTIVSALIAGIVVGGLGARLVMRLSAMASDGSAIGTLTENGNRVGDITAMGTIALLIFTGLTTGFAMGVFIFALRRILPGRYLPLSVSIVLIGLGGSSVIDPSNADFVILGNQALNVAMFLTLFPLFAVLTIVLSERFDRWLVVPPLVRLAPLTLAGTSVACGLGLLSIGVLGALADHTLISITVALVVVLGGVTAFAHGRLAFAARTGALIILAIGTAAGLIALAGDVKTIVG